jgi:hypothetical protein
MNVRITATMIMNIATKNIPRFINILVLFIPMLMRLEGTSYDYDSFGLNILPNNDVVSMTWN